MRIYLLLPEGKQQMDEQPDIRALRAELKLVVNEANNALFDKLSDKFVQIEDRLRSLERQSEQNLRTEEKLREIQHKHETETRDLRSKYETLNSFKYWVVGAGVGAGTVVGFVLKFIQ